MGNLFIGFPVPRAKIADMISTAAPPLLHHVRHESGGDDEITIPPAGMSTPYDDSGFHYKTRFPTLDEFEVTEYQTAVVEHSHDSIILGTGETTGSYSSIKKASRLQHPLLTYDKDISIRFSLDFNVYSDVNPNSYIITAGETNQKHIGISIYNSKLACSVHDGNTRGQESIVSCPLEGEDYEFNVEIKFYSGSKVEYWVDGTLRHTQTDYIPSGAFYGDYFLKLCAANSNTTRDIFIGISMLELYQPAT